VVRWVIARDFASLTLLGVGNLDGVKWFYDKACLIFRGETRGCCNHDAFAVHALLFMRWSKKDRGRV
jgi:hypothetical protein